MLYLSLKWLHIVSIISWMAGILYLIRLFVNHAERGLDHDEVHSLLSLMEDRLYRIITLPAMAASWFAGAGMLSLNPGLLQGRWLHIKLACVLLLTLTTFYAGRLRGQFAARRQPLPSPKALRIINEIPTLLMFVIVAMVIFRPFS